MAQIGPSRDALVQDALLGVLEIASQGASDDERDAIRERVRLMEPEQREAMLDGFIDRDELARLVQQASAGRMVPSGMAAELEDWQNRLVSRALESLVRLVALPKAHTIIDPMSPELRAEVLLRSVRQPRN